MTGMNKRGFTIIEVLVATGLFSIILLVVVGIYITTISAQRRTFGTQNVLDSSRFALETMARAIRQSSVTSAGGSTLELSGHPDKGNITYTLNGEAIEESVNGASANPITSDDVVVETLIFDPQGTGTNDGEQPRITIFMEVRSKNVKAEEEHLIPIQTTVTPRGLQLEN